MSKVKVLGALELDVGTVSILHYPDLSKQDLAIADLPTMTLGLHIADTSKIVPVHLRVINQGGDQFDHPSLCKLVDAKFGELLRLEGVVKVYGNLAWDASVVVAHPGDEYATNRYSGDHHGPQYSELQGIVNQLLVVDQNGGAGFRRHRQNSIHRRNDGSSVITLGLPNNLQLTMSYPPNLSADGSVAARANAMVGWVTGPDQLTWSWELASVSYTSYEQLSLPHVLSVDDVGKHVHREMQKAFPYVPFEAGNFIAITGVPKDGEPTVTAKKKSF